MTTKLTAVYGTPNNLHVLGFSFFFPYLTIILPKTLYIFSLRSLVCAGVFTLKFPATVVDGSAAQLAGMVKTAAYTRC